LGVLIGAVPVHRIHELEPTSRDVPANRQTAPPASGDQCRPEWLLRSPLRQSPWTRLASRSCATPMPDVKHPSHLRRTPMRPWTPVNWPAPRTLKWPKSAPASCRVPAVKRQHAGPGRGTLAI